MIAPKRKTSELIDEINLMLYAEPNELKIRMIRNEAKKLESAGMLVDSKQVLGMLAAVNGDVDEVDRNFNIAVNASGQLPLIVMNYSGALANARSFRRAVEKALQAVERAPDDLGILVDALRIHIDAFDAIGAKQLSERIFRMGKEIPQKDLQEIAMKVDILKANGVDWNDVAARMELACNTLRIHGFSGYSSPVNEIYCDDSLLMEFLIRGDEETVSAAENAIHKAIADQPYSPADSAIAFACVMAV
jgi:hypothetical protein